MKTKCRSDQKYNIGLLALKAFFLIFPVAQSLHAQTLYLDAKVEIKSLPSEYQEQLFANQILSSVSQKGVRDEVVLYSQAFLNNEISADQFEKSLWQWSQAGWSQEERWILLDTFKKSQVGFKNKSNWMCRLETTDKCNRELFSWVKLPAALREFEGLILDGKAYPSVNWDNLKLSDSFYNWTFVSSKYASFQFRGTWKELQKQNVQLEKLVLGSCENPQAHQDIQSLQNQMYYDQNCIKPSLRPIVSEPSFYDRHKNTIWWTVGVAAGIGILSTLQGKSIVLDKPGFL